MAKKQPIRKKEFTPVDKMSVLKNLKKNMGLNVDSTEDLKITNALKPIEWIIMPEAYQEAIKLPGIPQGYPVIITGWSNTGKSTFKYLTIAACQRQGILPVIYETENSFDWEHAVECGVEATPVYGMVERYDEETGEVVEKEEIIQHDGFFMFFDSDILATAYGHIDHKTGKPKSKNDRTVAVIEDIAYSINDLLDKQESEEIPFPMCFIWDSVGSIQSYQSYTSKVGNNMFDAGAIQSSFNIILNDRIANSKKMNKEHTNTFMAINKIWNDGMNAGPGGVSLELKGGKGIFYASRLIIHLGGKAKSAVQFLEAQYKGSKVLWGTKSKMTVMKNHLPTPYNTTYAGDFVCVHNGIIKNEPSDVNNYKKENMEYIIKGISQNIDGEINADEIVLEEDYSIIKE